MKTIDEDPTDVIANGRAVHAADGTPLVKVRCPFCGRAHTHGNPRDSRAGIIGHRVAHCGGGEYVIEVARW